MAITINQVAFDYYNLQVEVGAGGASFGIVGAGCQAISYEWSIEREKMYGPSRLPVDRTDGQAEFDSSITLERYWFNYLVAKARELGLGLASLELVFALSYAKGDLPVVTDTLTGVKLNGSSHEIEKSGDTKLVVEVPLDIMNIYYDGVDVFGDVFGNQL